MYRARDCEDKLGPIQRHLGNRIRQLEAAGKYDALMQQPKKLRQDGREAHLKLKPVSFNIITGKAPWPTAANATAIPAPTQALTAVTVITAAIAPVVSSAGPLPASVQQSTGSASRAPATNAATLAAASTDTPHQDAPDFVDAGGAVPGADMVQILSDERAYFKGEVDSLRDELADMEDRSEARIQELEADVDDVGCQLEGKTNTLKDKEEELEETKEELEETKVEMGELKEELQEKKKEVVEANHRVAKVEEELERLKAKMSTG